MLITYEIAQLARAKIEIVCAPYLACTSRDGESEMSHWTSVGGVSASLCLHLYVSGVLSVDHIPYPLSNAYIILAAARIRHCDERSLDKKMQRCSQHQYRFLRKFRWHKAGAPTSASVCGYVCIVIFILSYFF